MVACYIIIITHKQTLCQSIRKHLDQVSHTKEFWAFTPCLLGTPGVSFGHLTSRAWSYMMCNMSYRCSQTRTSAGRGLDGGWHRKIRTTTRKNWSFYKWARITKIHNRRKLGELRILIFKRDPHTVDGQRVLIILISVVVPGNVPLHCGNVCYVFHATKEKGRQIIQCIDLVTRVKG